MKVSEAITLLQSLPQDVELVVNDINGGKVDPIKEIFLYRPNTELWPADTIEVVIQVNGA